MARKIKICTSILLIILMIGVLSSCRRPIVSPGTDEVAITNVVLSTEKEILLVDTSSTLTATVSPENATNKNLTWTSSFDEVAEVDANGVITAKSAGVTTISASSVSGDYTANAVVYVGDVLVSADFDEETEGINVNKFASIAAAVNSVEENKIIVILSGAYDEALTIGKSISLIGVDYPELKSIRMNTDNSELRIRGLQFKNTNFPQGGEATVKGAIDGELHIIDCKFNIDSEENRSGGYAIYASAGTDKLIVKSCVVDNYRYGIYAHSSGATFAITNNTFTNLTTGIGADIKVPNSNPTVNYPATGEIGDNTFLDVVTRAEFMFYGETYDGNLDFGDYTP